MHFNGFHSNCCNTEVWGWLITFLSATPRTTCMADWVNELPQGTTLLHRCSQSMASMVFTLPSLRSATVLRYNSKCLISVYTYMHTGTYTLENTHWNIHSGTYLHTGTCIHSETCIHSGTYMYIHTGMIALIKTTYWCWTRHTNTTMWCRMY